MIYPKSIAALIEQFQKFPSVGPKSAQRMAFQVLKMPVSEVEKFANAILEAKRSARTCEICFNISTQSPCEICESTNRNRSVICVVAETKDLIAIEKTNEYRGLYHVLQGLISPMDGIGAEDIRMKELLTRLTNEEVQEVIAEIDSMKFTLAVSNLVDNAIKYTDEGGHVKVILDCDHQNAFITVSDTGVGIADDEIGRIFDRFYRVDKTRDRETGGTGLGLSITHSTILMHNGSIKVSSRENEGTTFVVRIPLMHSKS